MCDAKENREKHASRPQDFTRPFFTRDFLSRHARQTKREGLTRSLLKAYKLSGTKRRRYYKRQRFSRRHFARVCTFSIQVHSQVLEDIHVRRMSDGRHGGGAAFAVNVRDGLCANVQN